MPGFVPYALLEAYAWIDTPMWVFDLERRRMAWANPAGLAFWAAASVEELAARDFSAMSEAVVARNEALMAEHAAGRTAREQWTVYPRGKPVTINAHSAGVRLPDGRAAILFEGHPVTERVEANALRAIEAIHHTSVRVALHRPTGEAILRNPAAVRTFGPVSETAATDELAAMFVDPEIAAAVGRALAGGESFSAEAELHTLDGPRWHGFDVRLVTDPATGGRLVQLNARDISDRRAAELALDTARMRAEAANLAKSRFLANMSHEIRTPLNGVMGMLELVQDSELGDEQRQLLALARESAESLLAIINEVLDFSRVEAGVLEVRAAPFDLGQLVRGVVATMAVTAAAKGLRLEAVVDPALPPTLVGDAVLVRQVLVNLVGNACKFTTVGYVEVEVRLDALDAGGATVTIHVRDSGIGIAEADRTRIFEPFVQADSSSTRTFGGTGLGLAICRRIVLRMGGDLTLDSELGVGSTFSVRLHFSKELP